MHTLASLSLVAAALPLGLAVPTKTGFVVDQVLAPTQGKLKTGARVTYETIKKYSKKEAPSHIIKAAAVQSGSVAANPEQYDNAYLSPVTIGGQTLNLDFDTGSADLWVFSSSLSASAQSGHSVYNPSKSSTSAVKSGYKWSISYGDGSTAAGTVYTDTVVVGGVTQTSQAVELATTLSSSFLSDTDLDGLLGLSFSNINTVTPTKQKTFFDNVKASLPTPVFSVDLKKGAAGSYAFGIIDSSKYTGAITYTSISSSRGYWELTGTGYQVGTGSFVSTSIDAIADTGTTLVYVPASVVSAYYKKVTGSSNSASYGGYVFPCSATLPDFYLGIGSYHAKIPGSYINYAPVTDGSSTCFGGIQSSADVGINIYGDIFLKAQYVVFDGSSSPRLGVAAKAT